MKNVILMLRKSEVDLLRSEIPDLVHRCDCIYSIHRYATDKNPSTSAIVLTNERLLAFRAARRTLERLSLVKIGKQWVGHHAAPVELLTGLDGRGYDFTPSHEEFERLKVLIDTQAKLEAKRIKQVQNLNGIKFSNIEEFEDALISKKMELLLLENAEYKDKNRINNTKYHIQAIEQVLNGDIRVNNYRKFNECRLYSTLTNLQKDLRKNLYTDYGTFYELDIKASQPRLVKKCFMIMLESFTIADYFIQIVKMPNFDENEVDDEMRSEFEIWKIYLIKELEKFNELTKDDFYLEVASEPVYRDDMKQQFMWYFFDYSKKITKGYYFHKYMIDNYPNIEKFKNALNICKSRFKYKSNLYDIPATFAKTEAGIILETICKRFVKANPTSAIFTVHDGINVNLKDLKQIVDLTTQAYEEAGVYLNFKLTSLATGESVQAQPPIYGTSEILRDSKDSSNSPYNRNWEIPYFNGSVESVQAQRDGRAGVAHNRPAKITTLADGRFQFSIKGRKIKSLRNETLEDFERRIKTLLIP